MPALALCISSAVTEPARLCSFAKSYAVAFTMQVLEDVIKYRWNALPAEQREGIKNYISQVVIKARFTVQFSGSGVTNQCACTLSCTRPP